MKTVRSFIALLVLSLIHPSVSQAENVATPRKAQRRLAPREPSCKRCQQIQINPERPFGRFDRPEFASAIVEGHAVDDLVVVTHQTSTLGRATAKFLERELESAPRLVLVYPRGTIPDYEIRGFTRLFRETPELFRQATLIEPSHVGEQPHPIRAQRVHLMGGMCDVCLSQTAMQIAEHAFADGRMPRFVLRPRYIFGDLIEPDLPTRVRAKLGLFTDESPVDRFAKNHHFGESIASGIPRDLNLGERMYLNIALAVSVLADDPNYSFDYLHEESAHTLTPTLQSTMKFRDQLQGHFVEVTVQN